MKPIVLATILASLLPLAALARECDKQNTPLCEQGFQWDDSAQACVEIVSG